MSATYVSMEGCPDPNKQRRSFFETEHAFPNHATFYKGFTSLGTASFTTIDATLVDTTTLQVNTIEPSTGSTITFASGNTINFSDDTIDNFVLTAAGDLITTTTGTALTRLAIGPAGSALVSSGTAPEWMALGSNYAQFYTVVGNTNCTISATENTQYVNSAASVMMSGGLTLAVTGSGATASNSTFAIPTGYTNNTGANTVCGSVSAFSAGNTLTNVNGYIYSAAGGLNGTLGLEITFTAPGACTVNVGWSAGFQTSAVPV